MRFLPLLFAVPLIFLVSGCSCTSQVEREDFTSSEVRELYAGEHPESAFQDNIRNGEIVRGMNEDEVVASWGMPNVYLISREKDTQRFIYYIQDQDAASVLVYMLDFDADNILFDWNIDEKRFTSFSLVDYDRSVDRTYGSATSKVDDKK